MSDEAGEHDDLQDAQMTGDDPMMKRAEMLVTGGDVRALGEPEPPGVLGDEADATVDGPSESDPSS